MVGVDSLSPRDRQRGDNRAAECLVLVRFERHQRDVVLGRQAGARNTFGRGIKRRQVAVPAALVA